MTLNEIRQSIRQLAELVNGWNDDAAISPIERDMALEKLRQLYEAIRFENLIDTPHPTVPEQDVTPVVVTPPTVETTNDEPESTEEEQEKESNNSTENLDLSDMLNWEPEEAPESEEETEPENQEQQEVDNTQSQLIATLFGPAEEHVRHQHKQRVILSLYGANSEPEEEEQQEQKEPKEEEIPQSVEPQPAPTDEQAETPTEKSAPEISETATSSENSGILGEVIAPHVQTLGDTFHTNTEATIGTQKTGCDDLRQIIGLNDKFLLIRDLFEGDEELFEKTISKINEFDNLDDCLIYLTENFIWNPNSDGVRMLVELLDRKFA